MPELPEVENFRKFFEESSLHQTISEMELKPDARKLVRPGLEELKKALTGRQFAGSFRIGKYLFAKTDENSGLIIHFGMTGNLGYFKDLEDEPRFAKILFHFENGFTLSYNSRRKFGWVHWVEDFATYRQQLGLGPDALVVEFDYFYQTFSKKHSPIKSRLMDQDALAGIGNWLADEILFQSRIHPQTFCDKLDENEYRELHKTMMSVLKISVREEADYDRFPDYFLVNHREKGGKCPVSGEPLEVLVVGGRTTYVSPLQKKL
jgi:formamidopyrimidine-DNA glycosylase